ncbi:MAG: shikimate kinase [Candidatus Margulisbacteria bacterium]|nr:shikimate kinase [Candidatus Margulisiibacteriota bacterium]
MNLPQNIILIGFMACGKSAIGHKIAEILGWEYVDIDMLIESQTKKKVKDIFLEEGEKAFRTYESEIAKTIVNLNNKVISTGGGIVLKPENVEALKKAGKLVLFQVEPETVLRRVKDYTTRPLLNYPDPEKRLAMINKLLAERENKYKNSADIVIDTNDDHLDNNARKVLKEFE